MSEIVGHKRVTCKRRRPNQLVHNLLESLHQAAVENRSSNVSSLKEAISSVEKYPLPLSSGAECAILKGFDRRLCRYIDSHLNGQLTNNKKTEVSDNVFSCSKKVKKLRLSQREDQISDSKMNSNTRKNSKNQEQETSLDKWPKSVKPSDDVAVDSIAFVNLTASKEDGGKCHVSFTKSSPTPQLESNNNTTTDFHVMYTKTPDAYFLDSSRSDEIRKIDMINRELTNSNRKTTDKIKIKNSQENSGRNVSDFFPDNNKLSSPKKCPLIEVLDSSTDENSNTEINLPYNNESINQLETKCFHDDVQCKQLEPIMKAVNSFEEYFKEKTKREAEEIGKCVLPRKINKPVYRSGAYAILAALLEQLNECPYRDCLTKEELIEKAQKHMDPTSDSNNTAWTSTLRLISKGLVQLIKYDNNKKYFYMLSAMGRAIATEVVKENTPEVTVNDVIFHGQRNDRVPSLEDVILSPPPIASVGEELNSVFIEMPPGTFDILMLIDKREHLNKTALASPNNYCRYESRSLNIGDFLWVARSRKTGQELVLPYIVERKRMDDLSSSIKDGRFHEQKFRLRKCGLQNVLYLVEYRRNEPTSLPMTTLIQAMVNTNILEEFHVVNTDSLDHTLTILGMISEKLFHEFSPKFLRGCNRDTHGNEFMTFDFFNKFSCKNKPLTVRDTFIKMLLQLKGLSIEKALAITDKYSTPRLLMKAYESCTTQEGELLLANLKLDNMTRNVGPTVSKTVYKLFSQDFV